MNRHGITTTIQKIPHPSSDCWMHFFYFRPQVPYKYLLSCCPPSSTVYTPWLSSWVCGSWLWWQTSARRILQSLRLWETGSNCVALTSHLWSSAASAWLIHSCCSPGQGLIETNRMGHLGIGKWEGKCLDTPSAISCSEWHYVCWNIAQVGKWARWYQTKTMFSWISALKRVYAISAYIYHANKHNLLQYF